MHFQRYNFLRFEIRFIVYCWENWNYKHLHSLMRGVYAKYSIKEEPEIDVNINLHRVSSYWLGVCGALLMRGLVFLCFCTSNAIIFVPILSRECERNFCNFLKQNEGFFVIRIFFLLISNVKAKFYIEHIEMRNKKFNLKQVFLGIRNFHQSFPLDQKAACDESIAIEKKKFEFNGLLFQWFRPIVHLFVLVIPS